MEIIVEIPKKFTPEQRAVLEKLLPDDGDVTDITGNPFALEKKMPVTVSLKQRQTLIS